MAQVSRGHPLKPSIELVEMHGVIQSVQNSTSYIVIVRCHLTMAKITMERSLNYS